MSAGVGTASMRRFVLLVRFSVRLHAGVPLGDVFCSIESPPARLAIFSISHFSDLMFFHKILDFFLIISKKSVEMMVKCLKVLKRHNGT